jgi:hypothetical protein
MGPLGLVVEHLAIVDMVAIVVVAIWIKNNNNVINRETGPMLYMQKLPQQPDSYKIMQIG